MHLNFQSVFDPFIPIHPPSSSRPALLIPCFNQLIDNTRRFYDYCLLDKIVVFVDFFAALRAYSNFENTPSGLYIHIRMICNIIRQRHINCFMSILSAFWGPLY
jgi:hypothetical protein